MESTPDSAWHRSEIQLNADIRLWLSTSVYWKCAAGQTLPATRNPQPATRNPQPATRNPQPATRNPQPATGNPQPNTHKQKRTT